MSELSLVEQIPHFIEDVKQWTPLPPKRNYLTGLDATFLAAERPEARGQVAGVYIFEKRIDPELMKEQIEQYARTTGGRYMQRIVKNEWLFGRPYFEDIEKFDIDKQFEYIKLPAPGNDEQMAEVCGRAQTEDYDWQFPLMKCTYMDGVENGTKCALYWRAHHAIADGQGFTRALISYLATLDPVTGRPAADSKATVDRLKAMQFKAGRRKSSAHAVVESVKSQTDRIWDLLMQYYTFLFGIVIYIANMVWVGFVATGTRGRKSLWHPDPKKRNGMVPKQIGWTSGLSLAEVKRVKNVLGCSLNDLLLAAAAGGMQRYCKEKGQLKDRNFVMLVPTSLRRSNDFAISNESTGYMLSLPMDIDDPEKRVRVISQRMNLLKRSLEPMGGYLGIKLGFTFPWLYSKKMLMSNANKLHGGITNVPGPATPLLWGGVPLSRLIPIIPSNPNGLGLAIESYHTGISIGCCLDLDPDVPKGEFYGPGTAMGLCKAIEDEFYRIAAQADVIQRKQVRELVGKLGADVVVQELTRMKEEHKAEKGEKAHTNGHIKLEGAKRDGVGSVSDLKVAE